MYGLLLSARQPSRSQTAKLSTTTVLLDRRASISLIPLWQAKELKLDIKKRTDIVVRRADRRPVTIEGVAELYARDPDAMFWKHIKVIVTKTGS